MKLDFVCVGAQKAGTTTLHDILNQHPDIYLPPRKEAQFFDINERYEKGLQYYFDTYYNTYSGQKVIGNINPNLQIENRTIDRLHDCFGDNLKVIFILRNPVKRAYSHYLMSKRRGYETLTFFEALKVERERISNPKKYENYISKELGHYEKNHLGYIYRGLYSQTIKKMFYAFPKENLKFILFEELIKDREKVLNTIFEFLKLPPYYPGEDIQSNPATTPKSIWLRNFIYGGSATKKIFSRFLNQGTKEWIHKKLDKLNSRPLGLKEKTLTKESEKTIYELYFKEEINQVELLTGFDLNLWRY